MRDPVSFWKKQERILDRGTRAIRRAQPEALAELEETLARTALAAKFAREGAVAHRARTLRQSLARARSLERDRDLLTRLESRGLLSADAATALRARWEERSRSRLEKALRLAEGRAMRRLRRALSGANRKDGKLRRRLERARDRIAPRSGARIGPGENELSRCRKSFRRWARLQAVCANWERDWALPSSTARAVESLDHWHILGRLRKRLAHERRSASRRGGVALMLELDRAISALDASREAERREAVARIGLVSSNVVRFQRRSA